MLVAWHRQASVAQAVAHCCPPLDFSEPWGSGVFTSLSWPTSPLNRSHSQHNLLIDAEGCSAESSLSSLWQASIFLLISPCTHIYMLSRCMCTHTYAQLHLSLWLTLPTHSPEVEPDIIGVFCVCSLCNKEKRSGERCVERVLCGEEESADHAPQTSSVSLLDHTLMRHLCESRPAVRFSDAGSACCSLEKQQQQQPP